MALTCLHWNNHASKVNNGGECSQYIDSTLLEYHTKLDNTCTGQTPRNALTVVAFGSHCCDLCFANRLSIVERWRLTWWQNEVGVPGSSHNQCHQCHSPSCSQRYCATPHLYLNRIPGPLLPCNWIITLELVQTSLKLLVSFTEDIVLRRSWFLNAVNFTLVHFIIEEKYIFIFLLTLIGPWSFR